MEHQEQDQIKSAVADFLSHMSFTVASVDVAESLGKSEAAVFDVSISLDDPKIIIGQGGQTLFDLQRVLKIILNKRLGKAFYINLDINQYKQKKVEYLESLAKELADEVVLTKAEKVLSPMPSYERRVLHQALSARPGIISESQGDGPERHIVIKYATPQ